VELYTGVFDDEDGDLTSAQFAGGTSSLRRWLSEVLQAERTAVNEQLLRQHRALLSELDTRVQQSIGCCPTSPAFGGASSKLAEDSGVPWERSDVSPGPMRNLVPVEETDEETKRQSDEDRPQTLPVEQETEGSSAKRLAEDVSPLLLNVYDDRVVKSSSAVRACGSRTSLSKGRSSEEIEQEHEREKRKVEELSLAMTHKKEYSNPCEAFVANAAFEALFAGAICFNTLVMALQVQYDGNEMGYVIGYPGYDQSATDSWPGAHDAFVILEVIFGLLFTVELVLKIVALRTKFPHQAWNWLDSFIVLFWLVDKFTIYGAGVNPMMLRLFRIARLLRVIKLLKWLHMCTPIALMCKALGSSFAVLFWAIVLLVVVQMASAMLVSQCVGGYIIDFSNAPGDRRDVFTYYGSFSRALVTMFEITLANWAPPCRILSNNIDEWWGVFVVFYKMTVGFAMINVITGVFLHETFKAASNDDEIMILQKKRANQMYVEKLQQLFTEVDVTGDGFLSWEEFEYMVSQDRVKTYLSALEVDVVELEVLFKMLDDGDGKMSFDEFCGGVKRVKGNAKSMDMVKVLFDVQKLSKVVTEIAEFLAIDTGPPSRRLSSCEGNSV